MWASKIHTLFERLREKDFEIAIISSQVNIRYLTGLKFVALERPILLILNVKERKSVMFVPLLELERVKQSLGKNIDEVLYYADHEDPYLKLVSIIKELAPQKTVGLEGSTPFKIVEPILKSSKNIEIKSIDDVLQQLRVIKDQYELNYIRKASEILDKTIEYAFSIIKNGISEIDLADDLVRYSKRQGAEDVPFSIVQFGRNTSNPHGLPTQERLKPEEPVLIDIAAQYNGYFSDITRVGFFGKSIPEEYTRIHSVVLKAHDEAIARVRPGVRAKEVDRVARSIIAAEGYGRYFTHRTGHGLGLEVHEEPYIHSGNNTVLKEGMVFTVEPGIYLPEKYGVRIEDTVIVTASGCEVATKSNRAIIQISPQ